MKVVFAGTPDFAAGHLQTLINSHHQISAVICQPDKPGRRGKQPVIGPVKKAAIAADLSILQPEKFAVTDLFELDFDLLVVVAYGQILSLDILKYPKFGCINVHASLLPRWRGAAPVQRSILAGDKTTGITIMEIDEGLDTGDILAAQAFPIEPDDTSGTVFSKMLQSGTKLLVETIDQLSSGQVVPVPQNDEATCYAGKIRLDEARIDWTDSASSIDLRVRAFHPAPVAYTYLGKMRVKIHRGHPVEGSGIPGTVIDINKSGIEIACGTGAYRIEQIQLSTGKGKVMSPADIMNGRADLLHVNASFSATPTND